MSSNDLGVAIRYKLGQILARDDRWDSTKPLNASELWDSLTVLELATLLEEHGIVDPNLDEVGVLTLEQLISRFKI